MASLIYNKALDAQAKAKIDFSTDAFAVMLVTSGYAPDKDAHNFRSSVTNEVVGTGYTANGQTVTVSVNRDDANDRIDISLGSASWPTATLTARGAVYYQDTGNSATDILIAYIDFGGNVSSTAGTFSLSASTLRVQN
jgi:hypothetical protein